MKGRASLALMSALLLSEPEPGRVVRRRLYREHKPQPFSEAERRHAAAADKRERRRMRNLRERARRQMGEQRALESLR